MKSAGIPVLKKFLLIDTDVELTISKRGAAPLGGGEIHFKCPIYRNIKTIQSTNSGMVKRIRGVACSIRVSPAIANRMVDSAKEVLLNFIPDIYIHTDHCRGASSGKSPGTTVKLINFKKYINQLSNYSIYIFFYRLYRLTNFYDRYRLENRFWHKFICGNYQRSFPRR